MNWTQDKLDVLQNLEFAIVQIWRAHPEMTDYVAERAYEAAFQHYRAELRGHTPKPHGLTGLDAEASDALFAMCQFRLARGPCPVETDAPGEIGCVPLEQIVDSLRELSRSVRRHTGRGGRQGYLTFIDGFLP
ncbi:MAG: hypothetical protein ACREIA_01760 [Opitutaceae bacterium]